MARLKGRLIDPTLGVISNAKITLTAKKTNATLFKGITAFIKTDETGLYDEEVTPGEYSVELSLAGQQDIKLSHIKIATDSPDGTLNDFLLIGNDESILTPDIVKQIQQYRDEAKASVEEIKSLIEGSPVDTATFKLKNKTGDTASITLDAEGKLCFYVANQNRFIFDTEKSKIRFLSEVVNESKDGYRLKFGDYGTFFKNDGTKTYLLITNKGDADGQHNNALRPLVVDNETGNLETWHRITAAKGLVSYHTVVGNKGIYDGEHRVYSPANPPVPAGTVFMHTGTVPAAGYLKMNGAPIDEVKYPKLAQMFGTHLPDLRAMASQTGEAATRQDSASVNYIIKAE